MIEPLDPHDDLAVRTIAAGVILRRWVEGSRMDRQDVVLVEGPWGYRLVDAFGPRWTAYAVDDLDAAIALIEHLVARGDLFNVGACFDPVPILEAA